MFNFAQLLVLLSVCLCACQFAFEKYDYASTSVGGVHGFGGTNSIGGQINTGGLFSTGGRLTGGSVSTGGTTINASVPTGGALTSIGGTSSTGGNKPTSGSIGSGGANPTGGSSSFPCAGISDFGICWYLGVLGNNCITTCAPNGGTSPNTAVYIGPSAQGGDANCALILSKLGVTGSIQDVPAQFPVGCMDYLPNSDAGVGVPAGPAWVSVVNVPLAYDDTIVYPNGKRACGCQR